MTYTKKKNIIIVAIVFLVGILAGSLSKQGKEIIKYFSADEELYFVEKVIDGDTFWAQINTDENTDSTDNIKVRFINIDAPERGKCYFSESTKALKDLIEGKYVKLIKDVSDKGEFGRLLRYVVLPNTQMDTDVNTDITDNEDILVDKYLAENGFVKYVSSPLDKKYYQLISVAQWRAYDNKLGMWGACGYKPDNINKRQQDTGPENKDCIIKGNISEKGFGKTYVIPGCDNYNSVKIDIRKGEKYFCTEQEAIDAGFRKAHGCPGKMN